MRTPCSAKLLLLAGLLLASGCCCPGRCPYPKCCQFFPYRCCGPCGMYPLPPPRVPLETAIVGTPDGPAQDQPPTAPQTQRGVEPVVRVAGHQTLAASKPAAAPANIHPIRSTLQSPKPQLRQPGQVTSGASKPLTSTKRPAPNE